MSAVTDRDKKSMRAAPPAPINIVSSANPSIHNRYSQPVTVDMSGMRLPIGCGSSMGSSPLMQPRCRHSDWEQCEEQRLRELEEVGQLYAQTNSRARQMEKTMKWWSDCTASWRDKWARVRDERNACREELRETKSQIQGYKSIIFDFQNEKKKRDAEKNQMERAMAKLKHDKNRLEIEVTKLRKVAALCIPTFETETDECGEQEDSCGDKCRLQGTIESLRSEVSMLNAKCDHLEALKLAVQEEADENKALLQEHQAERDQEKHSDMVTKIEDLEREKDEAKEESVRLQTENDAVKQQLAILQLKNQD